jgi:hypothetical protein
MMNKIIFYFILLSAVAVLRTGRQFVMCGDTSANADIYSFEKNSTNNRKLHKGVFGYKVSDSQNLDGDPRGPPNYSLLSANVLTTLTEFKRSEQIAVETQLTELCNVARFFLCCCD